MDCENKNLDSPVDTVKEGNGDCPYCHGDEALIDDNGILLFIDKDGNLDAFDANANKGSGRARYCPQCGEKKGQ